MLKYIQNLYYFLYNQPQNVDTFLLSIDEIKMLIDHLILFSFRWPNNLRSRQKLKKLKKKQYLPKICQDSG